MVSCSFIHLCCIRAHLWRIWKRLMEKISTSTIFGNEIAGLLKKKPEDEEYDDDDDDDTKIVKSRKSEFSRGELRARRKSRGIMYSEPLDYC